MASLGKSEKDALRLEGSYYPSHSPSLSYSSSRPPRTFSRHAFDFFLSLDARTQGGSVQQGAQKMRGWTKRRRRRRRRRIGAFAEEVDAAMHWRRCLKLSFSHNSLESLPLNSVIGCAIGSRMRYKLR